MNERTKIASVVSGKKAISEGDDAGPEGWLGSERQTTQEETAGGGAA